MHILTSVKSLSRNDQYQQQEKYPETFHLFCFQSALSCFENLRSQITVCDYWWVSLYDVLLCIPQNWFTKDASHNYLEFDC